ncbi:hypothetical protein [Sulfurimonas sp.]|uniref:hypothetical protein n=1 Tax=Sulfurimonas sp. TaxID=2022749 RepID=UPI002B463C9C|nr:hypothetical protein [Sulfurimonas sp.]
MRKQYKLLVASIITMMAITGCSHKISINPSLEKIRETTVENKLDINVGYYISKHNKKLKVTTPGGGGDKVEYMPYKDTESALNTILSKVFNRVYSLKSFNDKEYIESKSIKYIFTPKIKTNSSSDSAFTWPPTKFTVALTCEAVNLNGSKVWEETTYEEGNAEFDEFKENFSLSAQRATEKAFQSMLNKLKKSDSFK